uniref:Uncharacterized protein n=1 Tax=Guillardia theta TaxID=55529 RepID=A0A7S4P9A9_GUITH|mmetsp:Transcript_46065/g.144514  ORF Transcript_46065/g.144514 Transcript_46065/m.144514 type:complete len:289 (+) Transcript_46065:184-1050(+)
MEIEAKDTVPAEASAINPPQVEEGTGGNREREGSHDEMRWEIHEAKEDAGSVVEKTLALLVKSSEAAKAGRDYADIIDTMQQAVDCLCSIKGESSQQSLVQAVMRDEDIYLACCMLIDVCLHPSAGDHDVALRFLATIFQWQEESNGENDSAHLVVCSLLPSILLTYWAVLSEDRHAPLLSALEALLVGMYNLEVQGKGSAECCVLLSKLPSSKTAAQYDTMSDGRLSSPSAILSESALKSMLADDVGESEASFHQKTLCSSPVSRIDNSSVDSNPVLEFWLGRLVGV